MKTLMTTLALAAAVGAATVSLAAPQAGFFDPRNQHSLATPDRGAKAPYALTGSARTSTQAARATSSDAQKPSLLLNPSVGARPVDAPTPR